MKTQAFYEEMTQTMTYVVWDPKTLDAVVIDQRAEGRAVVQVEEPAVLANATGDHELGTRVSVRLTEASISTPVQSPAA